MTNHAKGRLAGFIGLLGLLEFIELLESLGLIGLPLLESQKARMLECLKFDDLKTNVTKQENLLAFYPPSFLALIISSWDVIVKSLSGPVSLCR